MEFSKLKNYLDEIVSEYHVPGLDCIVYQNHEMVFRHFSGLRDRENQIKMDGNELYLIYSMSKMLTCVCALQLLEKGAYCLYDRVSEFIPEFKTMKVAKSAITQNGEAVMTGQTAGERIKVTEYEIAKNPILVRHLFSMTAGFDYNLEADYIKKAVQEGKKTTRDIVRSFAETTLLFEPGTNYHYSLCHDVLGALVEVWSGQTLGKYMREHIFEPLGMKDTFFNVPRDAKRLSRMAPRYAFEPGIAEPGKDEPILKPLVCDYTLAEEYESGGAGLTSSAEDYALFLDAMANNGVGKTGARILSPASIELMQRNHLEGQAFQTYLDEGRPGYGYGLGVRTHMDPAKSGSLSSVGEFGWGGAAGAFALVDPKHNLSMTYFQEVHGLLVPFQTKMRNVLYGCID